MSPAGRPVLLTHHPNRRASATPAPVARASPPQRIGENLLHTGVHQTFTHTAADQDLGAQ